MERGDRMYGLTRATITLIAAAAAGLLIWFATQIDDKSVGGFWAVYGLTRRARPHRGRRPQGRHGTSRRPTRAARTPQDGNDDDGRSCSRRTADRRPGDDYDPTRTHGRSRAGQLAP